MTDADRGASRYTAFLSYSHKDSAAAHWLHRKLESYRIPRRLVGTDGEHGPVPARLTPIFRDREELPAAGDLSEKVRDALAASDNLIVLCSPTSAASPWVAKEIAVFRELHPGRPIFAAIVEGEPEQCFPSGLAEGGVEPLAADLRPGRDGRRLGFLKLVAGLTGVGLDALVQRDAQRRVRNITYVTAFAVATMLIMALLAIYALNARSEAERQRADAEGLVEFMRTDLRDILRSVGRLDVLTAVNRRALQRYASQDLEGLPADALGRRAQILHLMGEDDVARSEYEVAIAAFREAHRTTDALLKQSPNDPERIFGHGQSEYWIGRIHELRSEWPQARMRYARYEAAARRLIGLDPQNPDYMLEMAWGASNRGVIQRDGSGNQEAAQRSFKEAIHWFERAIRARPRDGDRRDLANVYGDLADTFHKRSMWREALDARLRAHAIVDGLLGRDPGNVELAFRLAVAERAIAHESARDGNPARGRPFLARAYDRAQRLTKGDPRNADWLLLRVKIECDLLDPSLGLASLPESSVRGSLLAGAQQLRDKGDPRISNMSKCLLPPRGTPGLRGDKDGR